MMKYKTEVTRNSPTYAEKDMPRSYRWIPSIQALETQMIFASKNNIPETTGIFFLDSLINDLLRKFRSLLVAMIAQYRRSVNRKNAIVLLTAHQKYYGIQLLYPRSLYARAAFSSCLTGSSDLSPRNPRRASPHGWTGRSSGSPRRCS